MATANLSMPSPNLADNAQAGVYVACCVCFPVALIMLVLRFTARRLMEAEIWYDDWFIVVAMLGDVGFFISTMILLKNGMGKHYQTDTQEQYVSFAKTYIPAACFYAVGIATTKLSLLAFYYRIFSATKSIILPIRILSLIVLGWMIAVVFVSIFSCTPVAYWWDRTIQGGHCVNNTAFLLGNSVPNICTDFFILSLPMPYIWKLNQSLGRKIAVSGLFLLGGFVCIVTIVRLVIQLHTDFASPDLTWSITDFVTWTNVEVSLAIVSACLPSLRPIISYVNNSREAKQATNSTNSYRAYGFGAYAGRARPASTGLEAGHSDHIRLDSRGESPIGGSEVDEHPLTE